MEFREVLEVQFLGTRRLRQLLNLNVGPGSIFEIQCV